MIKSDNWNLEHRLKKAATFEQERKYLHAYQVFESLIEDYPDESQVYLRASSFLENMKGIDAAIEMLERGLERLHDDDALRLNLGHLLFKSQRWEETIAVLANIPISNEPLVAFFKGYSYYSLGEDADAIRCFEIYLSLGIDSPFVPDAYMYLAKSYINLTDYEKALANLRVAEKYYPDNHELHYYYAKIYHVKGMSTHATLAIEKAIKLKRSDKSVLELAGSIYLKSKEYQQLENLYMQFLERNEPTSEIITLLGLACYYSDRIIDAEVHLETALKLNPNNSKAVMALKALKQKRRGE